ncbi:hypothetical protein [Methylocella silvestris]|uniref:hypothetical protein n=1 Tax=Methylocella silvestris TaxID=199596 RepID=UPI0011D0DADE|nr:hypothetical protein [Methylocella silvestris]
MMHFSLDSSKTWAILVRSAAVQPTEPLPGFSDRILKLKWRLWVDTQLRATSLPLTADRRRSLHTGHSPFGPIARKTFDIIPPWAKLHSLRRKAIETWVLPGAFSTAPPPQSGISPVARFQN